MNKAEIYHAENPHIYVKFEELTLKTIKRGFKNYSSKGVFEILRWESGVSAIDGEFKINNNYTPFYTKLFEELHPQYKGFFRKRTSKFYNDEPKEIFKES